MRRLPQAWPTGSTAWLLTAPRWKTACFTLAADFLIPESADAQRILSVLWTLLGAADQHHIGELRDMIGPLPNRVEH